jgi:Flp pilus assembly protein TadG
MKASQHSQKGVVAVFVAVGLVALIAMVGLALDTGHLILNKSRLQSTVDAAALAAAKVLDDTGSQTQATAAARSVFDLNAASQPELARVLSGNSLVITYSNTLSPFVAGSAPANYVRVLASGFTMWSGFASIVGITSLTTAASAVAGWTPVGGGPGSQACDLAPMMVCKTATGTAANNWGNSTTDVTLMKIATGTGSPVGPGNFQLIQLGQPGANELRKNMAGSDYGCTGSTVTTKPGNNVGPTAEGLNTRFNQYQGPVNATDYPPDVLYGPSHVTSFWTNGTTVYTGGNPKKQTGGTPVTSLAGFYAYTNYSTDLTNTSSYDKQPPSARPKRRVLAVPIVDCSTMVNGQGTLPVVGYGCFFLLQPAEQSGTQNYVYGQFITKCEASGSPSPTPGPVGGSGPHKIVLYNDPNSADS